LNVTASTHASVTNFRIAWSEKYKIRNGEMRDRTCFINISTWLKLAEICKKSLAKGDKVYVEGKLITHDKINSQGVRYQDIEILAEKVEFLIIKDAVDETETEGVNFDENKE
jgi:single-strand DNA-binding protein